MYNYDLVLRINGSKDNEVFMEGCSPAEVMILRKLHGFDGVTQLVETKINRTPSSKERQRLIDKYVPKFDIAGVDGKPRLNFWQMFGEEHMPLPLRLLEFAEKEQEEKDAINPKPVYRKNLKEVDVDRVHVDDIAG